MAYLNNFNFNPPAGINRRITICLNMLLIQQPSENFPLQPAFFKRRQRFSLDGTAFMAHYRWMNFKPFLGPAA